MPITCFQNVDILSEMTLFGVRILSKGSHNKIEICKIKLSCLGNSNYAENEMIQEIDVVTGNDGEDKICCTKFFEILSCCSSFYRFL